METGFSGDPVDFEVRQQPRGFLSLTHVLIGYPLSFGPKARRGPQTLEMLEEQSFQLYSYYSSSAIIPSEFLGRRLHLLSRNIHTSVARAWPMHSMAGPSYLVLLRRFDI
jgi:hypothetical protein